MIKYTTGFVDKLEDILQESKYTVRYERGNFQSGWCLLDHKRVVVLNKFLNTEGRVNTLVDLIPQLKIDYDKLTLSSQKLFDFLTENRLDKIGVVAEPDSDAANAKAKSENVEAAADADADAAEAEDKDNADASPEEVTANGDAESDSETEDKTEEADADEDVKSDKAE